MIPLFLLPLFFPLTGFCILCSPIFDLTVFSFELCLSDFLPIDCPYFRSTHFLLFCIFLFSLCLLSLRVRLFQTGSACGFIRLLPEPICCLNSAIRKCPLCKIIPAASEFGLQNSHQKLLTRRAVFGILFTDQVIQFPLHAIKRRVACFRRRWIMRRCRFPRHSQTKQAEAQHPHSDILPHARDSALADVIGFARNKCKREASDTFWCAGCKTIQNTFLREMRTKKRFGSGARYRFAVRKMSLPAI